MSFPSFMNSFFTTQILSVRLNLLALQLGFDESAVKRSADGKFAPKVGGSGLIPSAKAGGGENPGYQQTKALMDASKVLTANGRQVIQQVAAHVAKSVKQAVENVDLEWMDEAQRKSDLASRSLGSEKASDIIHHSLDSSEALGSALQKIGTAAMLRTIEKLSELNTGRDIKSLGDVGDELNKTKDAAVEVEKEYLSTQFDRMKIVGDRLAKKLEMFAKAKIKELQVANQKRQRRQMERDKESSEVLKHAQVQVSAGAIRSFDDADRCQAEIKQISDRLDSLNIKKLVEALNSSELELNAAKILDEIFDY